MGPIREAMAIVLLNEHSVFIKLISKHFYLK